MNNPLKEQVGGDHYRSMPIQVVEFCHKNSIPFMEGAVIKYMCRWRDKGGKTDLLKAKHFIDLIIQMEYDTIQTPTSSSGLSAEEASSSVGDRDGKDFGGYPSGGTLARKDPGDPPQESRSQLGKRDQEIFKAGFVRGTHEGAVQGNGQ